MFFVSKQVYVYTKKQQGHHTTNNYLIGPIDALNKNQGHHHQGPDPCKTTSFSLGSAKIEKPVI